MVKYKVVRQIDCWDWDEYIKTHYNKPYKFQQQAGCRDRGSVAITVPADPDDDFDDDWRSKQVSLQEWIDAEFDGSFDNTIEEYRTKLEGNRNFYPPLAEVINDLYDKGLLEAGDYEIIVDW